MSNLKRSIFWARAVQVLYILLLTAFIAIFIADSIWEKLLFVILDISLVLVFVLRYPKWINDPWATTSLLITSITLTLVGGFAVAFDLLIMSQPLPYSEPENFIPMAIVFALMLPFGIVSLLFTVLSLKSKKIFPPK